VKLFLRIVEIKTGLNTGLPTKLNTITNFPKETPS
jgi:hypothetical protein